jgi:hypothetical protein
MSAPLPDGWTEHKTKAGKTYYYHAATKKSSWKDPRPVGEGFSNDGSFMERVRAIQAAASDAEAGASSLDGSDASEATLEAVEVKAFTSTEAEGRSNEGLEGVSAVGDLKRKPAEDEDGSVGNKPKSSRFKAAPETKASDAAQAYLNQVQQLTAMDKQTDSSGGKWLVR